MKVQDADPVLKEADHPQDHPAEEARKWTANHVEGPERSAQHGSASHSSDGIKKPHARSQHSSTVRLKNGSGEKSHKNSTA